MRARLWIGVGIAVGCLAAGVAFVAPGLPRRLGLDFWAVPGLRRDLEASLRANDYMDADLAELPRRAAVTEAILRDLSAGRLTLNEAADLRREIMPPAAWSAHLAALHFYYPGLNDEECVCRNLVARARERSPGDGLAAVERLEREWTSSPPAGTSPGLQ